MYNTQTSPFSFQHTCIYFFTLLYRNIIIVAIKIIALFLPRMFLVLPAINGGSLWIDNFQNGTHFSLLCFGFFMTWRLNIICNYHIHTILLPQMLSILRFSNNNSPHVSKSLGSHCSTYWYGCECLLYSILVFIDTIRFVIRICMENASEISRCVMLECYVKINLVNTNITLC